MLITELLRRRLDERRSLPAILAAGAARGDHAMVFLDGDGGARALPYASLYARASAIASKLGEQGLRPGDPVVLFFDEEEALVLALWAVFIARGVAVPLSAPAGFSAGDEALRKILAVYDQCAARGAREPIVLSDVDFDSLAGVPDFRDRIPRGGFFHPARWAAAPAEGAGVAPPVFAELEDLAILMFSSGSTGDPKGVRLTHGQILANLVQLCERSELTAEDRSLSWLPLTHDMGLVLFHLCHTLAGIPQFKMTPMAFARNPALLLDHVGAHRISVLGMPNFGYDQLYRAAESPPVDPWALESIRLIYNGAEPIDPQLCRRFVERFAVFGLRPHTINPGWGIAEASVAASGFPHGWLPRWVAIPSLWISAGEGMRVGRPVRPCDPRDQDAIEIVALGPPMSGMRLRVLDDSGGELPGSCLGHLEMQGPNVTRGYLDEADRDWCATGDIGFVHEGLVYLTGRAKDVLFLNGRNHFSNDIESALSQKLEWPANQLAVVGITHPKRRIEQVVLFFRQGRGGDRALQADRMRRALESLLAYPVAAAIGLPVLPKTTSGKIRRFALREALLRGDHDAALSENARRACRPASVGEAQIIEVARSMLPDAGTEIDPDSHLSRYGLDSVGFTQLAFRLSTQLARQVAPNAVVRAGSVAKMVAVVDAARPLAAGPAVVTGARVPLTGRQRSLWMAWLIDPASAAYHETYWMKLAGAIDAETWLRAARSVVEGHPMLQAGVDDRGAEPVLALFADRIVDVAHIACAAGELDAAMASLAGEAFDLRRGPLLRLRLLSTAEGPTIFLSAHHLVTDGWSLQGLISQIFEVYGGGACPPAERELWYEPTAFSDATLEAARARVAAADPIQLPREGIQATRGPTGQVVRTLSTQCSNAMRDWRVGHGSEFTGLAAALMTLLARLAGVRSPLLGTVVSGRYDQQAQSRVGYFATTVPLVADLPPDATFSSLVDALEPMRLAMLAGDMPDLAALDVGGPSIAQAMHVVYIHQNTAPVALPPGLTLRGQGRLRGPARIDLCVSSTWRDKNLDLLWEFDTHRFGEAQIAGYAELFEHALAQLLSAPARSLDLLDLLSPAQKALWQPLQGISVPVEFDRDVVDRFDARARSQPEQLALSDEGRRYTYGELRARVDALCIWLEEREVNRGDRVALLTERTADYVIALLACFKVGAVAVPIDPALPVDRVEQILSDAEVSLLLTTPGVTLDGKLADGHPTLCFHGQTLGADVRHPGRKRDPSDGAYLIFTSGSTGKPKGVLVPHRALTNLVSWVPCAFGYQPGDTICQFAPFSFDVSMAEILPSLCAGLHIHVLPADRRKSPDLYLETMRDEQVRVATITPAYLAVLNEAPQRCRESLGHLCLLILGGEALKTEEVQRFREHSPHVAILNVYGPTEATVLCSAYRVPAVPARAREVQPLGYPIHNTEMWILDEAERVCPATVTGTLYIAGDGLAGGYWRDDAKTAGSFHVLSPDGLAPRRFYCSGDLARLAVDGEIEFVGRADTQIKLRGFRIELGEIEAVLEQHPEVTKAVVVAAARDGAEKVLVAYHSGGPATREVLDAFLRSRLPPYMVPSFYVPMSDWPLTTNRKVDRKRLPPPGWQATPAAATGPHEPMSDTEKRLAAIWVELLGAQSVSRTAQFALLGGSSLNAAQLVNRIRERFGRELSLKEIILAPTLAEMAGLVDGSGVAALPDPTRRHRHPGQRALASEAQARMVFMDRAHPNTPLNNMPLTLALGAAVNEARLRTSALRLAERHAILRARMLIDTQGVFQSNDTATPHLEVLSAADRTQAVELLRQFHRRPFDLEQGPLWRVALARAEDTGQEWLALGLHHAIGDGVTLVRLLVELDALYRGSPLPPTGGELAYADYAEWQQELLASEFGDRAVRFWGDERRQRRAPKLPLVSPAGEDVTGRQFAVDLDPRQKKVLRGICDELGISPFVLMFSLFGFVIGQKCGEQQFSLGVTLSGRSRRAVEQVPGLFVNTLPLAFDWQPKERLSALLQRVKSQVAELQDWQDFPLNRAMAAQKSKGTPFNVLFNEEVLPAELSFAGARATLEGVSTGIAKFPLLVSFLFGDTWRFRMECRETGCPADWVTGLVEDVKRLVNVLDGMTGARLSDLEAPDERVIALLGIA